MAQPKHKGVKYWKDKAWEQFSLYIRITGCLKTMNRKDWGRCYTCGAQKERKDLQAGHFIPGRHPAYLFDEEQVRPQCYHCNVGLKGNWPQYYLKMVEELGKGRVEELLTKKRETKQFK